MRRLAITVYEPGEKVKRATLDYATITPEQLLEVITKFLKGEPIHRAEQVVTINILPEAIAAFV